MKFLCENCRKEVERKSKIYNIGKIPNSTKSKDMTMSTADQIVPLNIMKKITIKFCKYLFNLCRLAPKWIACRCKKKK